MTSAIKSALQDLPSDALKSLSGNAEALIQLAHLKKSKKKKSDGPQHEVDYATAKATIQTLGEQADVMAELGRAQLRFHEALDELNKIDFIGDLFRAEGATAISDAYSWLTGARGGPKIPRSASVREAAAAIKEALDAPVTDHKAIQKAVEDGEKLVGKCLQTKIDFTAKIRELNKNIHKYVNHKAVGVIVDVEIKEGTPEYKKYKDRLKRLKLVQKAAHKIAEWGAEAADVYGFGWAVELAEYVIVDGGGHAAKQQIRGQAKDHFEKSHTSDDVLEILDDDPLMIPAAFIKKQKSQVDAFLGAISPAMNMAIPKAWEYLKSAIETALNTYLEARLNLVKAGFDEKPTREQRRELWRQHQAELREQVKAVFDKEIDVQTVARTAWKYGRMKPGDLAELALKRLIKEAMIYLMTYFPPDPAQRVSGADLNAKLVNLLDTEYGAATDIQSSTEPRAAGVPATTKGGNPVVGSEPSLTKDGRFWVTVDHPTYGLLRGYLDPDGTFEPLEPAKSNVDDWSNRTVNIRTGSFRENGTEVAGTWYKPWPDRTYYLFVTEGGRHLWVDGFTTTRSRANLSEEFAEKMQSMPAFEWTEAL
jgi:hypothetical protein